MKMKKKKNKTTLMITNNNNNDNRNFGSAAATMTFAGQFVSLFTCTKQLTHTVLSLTPQSARANRKCNIDRRKMN